MNKKIVAVLTLIILTMALFSPKQSQAFWPFDSGNKNQSTSQFPTIIQKIVDKFKLNSDEVKKVVDETRTERQKQRQAKYEEWLDILVKAGKINDTQKQAILKKHEEMQNQQQTEWQQRETKRQELEAWAKENNIDTSYLFGAFGRMGGMHNGPFFGK